MADDTRKTDAADRRRINVHEDYELRDWSKRFGVSPSTLVLAVQSVGDQVDDVERYLKQKTSSRH